MNNISQIRISNWYDREIDVCVCVCMCVQCAQYNANAVSLSGDSVEVAMDIGRDIQSHSVLHWCVRADDLKCFNYF